MSFICWYDWLTNLTTVLILIRTDEEAGDAGKVLGFLGVPGLAEVGFI